MKQALNIFISAAMLKGLMLTSSQKNVLCAHD